MLDILIIGSGPAGLSASVYAARAGLSFSVLEREENGTGQIALTHQVDNYPGLLGITGFDLGERLRLHAEKLGADFICGEATKITPLEQGFDTLLSDGNALRSKTIIYAAGTRYRPLDIKGGDLEGISYCASCDGAFYKDCTVAVIGGGDTALTDALYLSNTAKRVLVIHRRKEFRAASYLVKRAKETPNIEFLLNTRVTELKGEKTVKSVVTDCNGIAQEIPVDGVFAAIGSDPNTAILKEIADLDNSGYIKAQEDGITSLSGLFAAGDVRTKALRQVVTAVSDGANCVSSAEAHLNLTQ